MQIQLVKKTAIIESGDFNLSAARYLDKVKISSQFDIVLLSDVITFLPKSKRKSGDGQENGNYNFFVSSQTKIKKFDTFDYSEESIILGTGGQASIHIDKEFCTSADTFIFKSKDQSVLTNKFIYHMLRANINILEQGFRGGGLKHLSKDYVKNINIPLPPLEIQEQIVKEIEVYQQIIDGCRQVVENYKPVINIDPSWEKLKLKEISEVIMGQSPKSVYYNDNNQGLPFYQGKTHFGDRYLKKHSTYTSKITKESNQGDIVMSVRAPVGSVNLTPFEICIGRGLCAIRPKNIDDLIYIYYYLQQDDVIKGDMGATYESINREKINETEISYPKNRFELAKKLEQEREVIEGNKELIKIYEDKINARINKVWSDN